MSGPPTIESVSVVAVIAVVISGASVICDEMTVPTPIAAASAPFVVQDIRELDEAWWRIDQEAQLYGTVPEAIEAAGGREKLMACGTVYTGNFQTQAVAWYMHLHEMESEIFAFPPGTTIAPSFSSLSRDPRFPTIAKTRKWVIGSSCHG